MSIRDTKEMDMPCNCPLCGELVELNDMKPIRDYRKTKLVCPDCWDDVEQEQ